MRLRSFATVAVRLMGLMAICFGVIIVAYLLVTFAMFSEVRMGGMGSIIFLQFLLPGLLILLGIVLMAASRALGESLARGLE